MNSRTLTMTFPLLRLPPSVLTMTLQSMDTLNQVAFSFVSKRTKTLIVSLNLNASRLMLVVGDIFSFSLRIGDQDIRFHLCLGNAELPGLLKFFRVSILHYYRRVDYYWRKEGYRVKDWILHLMTIAHRSIIDQFQLYKEGRKFEVSLMKNALQGLEIGKLAIHDGEYRQAVFDVFPLKNLFVNINHNQNSEQFRNVFMQNYDSIEIRLQSKIKLNQLQMINGRIIDITTRTIDITRHLNPFLKLWRKGSNPRLEYLRYVFNTHNYTLDADVILKGIKHQVVSNEVVREFKLPNDVMLIYGGFDIQDDNRSIATVRIQPAIFEVFVWPQ